jgi:hypothetical protein
LFFGKLKLKKTWNGKEKIFSTFPLRIIYTGVSKNAMDTDSKNACFCHGAKGITVILKMPPAAAVLASALWAL